SLIKSIEVVGLGGDDTISVGLASDMTRARNVTIMPGEGNDHVTLDFGLHKSHAISANLNVLVVDTTGDGNDTIQADFGDVNAASLTYTALAGGGNDTNI